MIGYILKMIVIGTGLTLSTATNNNSYIIAALGIIYVLYREDD